MRRPFALLMMAALFAAPQHSFARSSGYDAERACKVEARDRYNADGFRNITVANQGHGRFRVDGTIVIQGGKDLEMRCTFDGGRVVNMNASRNSNSSNNNAAIGAAIGLAIGAVILGAVSDDHRHDDFTGSSSGHGNGWDNRYSPERGIICYPRQRACYESNGDFSQRWTRREFQGGSNSSGDRVAERDMQRFCQGEASARFHQRPQDIQTLPVERDRGNYSVYGQFPPSGRRVTTFVCTFNADRRLLGVEKT